MEIDGLKVDLGLKVARRRATSCSLTIKGDTTHFCQSGSSFFFAFHSFVTAWRNSKNQCSFRIRHQHAHLKSDKHKVFISYGTFQPSSKRVLQVVGPKCL